MKNEKTFRKFVKKENFDDLNTVVKKDNDYDNTKYKIKKKENHDEVKEIKNLIILNDQKINSIIHYYNALS